MMADMLDELAPRAGDPGRKPPPLCWSHGGGAVMQQIRHMAGSGYPIIRMMPTPVARAPV